MGNHWTAGRVAIGALARAQTPIPALLKILERKERHVFTIPRRVFGLSAKGWVCRGRFRWSI